MKWYPQVGLSNAQYEEKNTRDPSLTWKRGDTIVCVDARGQEAHLTEGKQYEIRQISMISDEDRCIVIVSDSGEKHQSMAKRFKTISQIREDKLKELGI